MRHAYQAVVGILCASLSMYAIVARGQEYLRVPRPMIPQGISKYVADKGFRIPDKIDKQCAFDESHKGAHPFAIQGDFNGDGKQDYAVLGEKKEVPVNVFIPRTFVFLSNQKVYALDGREFIYLQKKGNVGTMDGARKLQFDAIGGVSCEKSSVLYIFSPSKNAFDEVFTGD